MTIKTARRYYLGKSRKLREREEEGLADVFSAKQNAEPGADLPSGFPHSEALEACGYTTIEDLDGASETELSAAGFSVSESSEILTELEQLV